MVRALLVVVLLTLTSIAVVSMPVSKRSLVVDSGTGVPPPPPRHA